ncbi:hypothetical protein K461DRAFT_329801 [Myriangium duriaei CBS 260.36]|uniref:NmrA-like domain-containing protein n=1 Tax=Myriangium duriaei CBS 260.36 TaxID=1168546 RepID=A0A9P4ISA1_9PEZI|nr:hypothetical protein K461DRAFT_329801 [Myriangium duriaei CBS 260.36]
MVHTVGLMGANGLVGRPTAQLLAQSAAQGKINLVILHRPGNIPVDFEGSTNVTLRAVDLDGPAADLEQAVRGIQTFINAVGFGALPSEPKLVDALAKSPDFVTFVPSTFSTTWTDEDVADEELGNIVRFIHGGLDRAHQIGAGTTVVYTGVFDIYFFEYAFVGSSVKQNLVWANKTQLQNRIPITSIEHLASALARIGTAEPKSVKNTEHSVVTFWPTGNEIAELYTKINGKPATIKDFTAADRDEIRADAAGFGPAKVGYWDHWKADSWDYEQEGRSYDRAYQGPGIEEVARRFA